MQADPDVSAGSQNDPSLKNSISMAGHPINLTGDLSDTSVPEIFHALSVARSTGVFEWTCFSREKKVYLHSGRIVFASSNSRTDRLGDILFREGRIKAPDFIEAAGKVSEQKRLGQILIEMGALTKEEIKEGVINQVRTIIYDLFNEPEGHYSFHEQENLLREVITLDINTAELILRGVERMTDWHRIVQTLSGIDTVFEMAAGSEKKLVEIALREAEEAVLSHINGRNSVATICADVGGNDFETCRTLMALLCANLIRRMQDTEIAVLEEKRARDFFEKTTRCYNLLFAYAYRYLTDKVGKLGDRNLSHYLEEIKEDHPVLFKGIFLLPDGTLASEALRENFERLDEETRKRELLACLKGLLAAELAAIRESLGTTEEAFVTSRLKSIMENLKKETVHSLG